MIEQVPVPESDSGELTIPGVGALKQPARTVRIFIEKPGFITTPQPTTGPEANWVTRASRRRITSHDGHVRPEG